MNMDIQNANANALTQWDLQRDKELNPDKKYKMLKKDGTWVYLGKLIQIHFNPPSYNNGGSSWWSMRFEIVPETNDHQLLEFYMNSSNTHIFEVVE